VQPTNNARPEAKANQPRSPRAEETVLGDVNRRNDATEDILTNVKTTPGGARAGRAGWHELAEAHLAALTSLLDRIRGRREAATIQIAPRQAMAEAAAVT
jgi:hypothetical protein